MLHFLSTVDLEIHVSISALGGIRSCRALKPLLMSGLLSLSILLQMEYERQVASARAQSALEGDFSVSQAEMSSRQAMLENASDIKVMPLLEPDNGVQS